MTTKIAQLVHCQKRPPRANPGCRSAAAAGRLDINLIQVNNSEKVSFVQHFIKEFDRLFYTVHRIFVQNSLTHLLLAKFLPFLQFDISRNFYPS